MYYRGLEDINDGVNAIDGIGLGSDTFIRTKGLSSYLFNVYGYEFLGGEVNYLGVGAYNVAYTGAGGNLPYLGLYTSALITAPEVGLWNMLQYAGFLNNFSAPLWFDSSTAGETHNITSIPSNILFTHIGSLNAQ